MGLEFDALYPDSLPERGSAKVPRLPAGDVLIALRDEMLIAATIAGDLARGVEVGAEDRARLLTCAARIDAGMQATRGR